MSQSPVRGPQRIIQMVESWEKNGSRYYFRCADKVLEVSLYSSNIFRFRYSPDGRFEDDFSYAIVNEEPPEIPDFQFALTETGDKYLVGTDELIVEISSTLHISIRDRKGNMICEDETGYAAYDHQEFGGYVVHCAKKIQEQEEFYGLGDKPCRSFLRGLRFELWGSDTYGFERNSDPLYKNIPFYYGLHHGQAYGIFFDNPFRSWFDFGHERSDVCRFWAEGGEMNYYFIYGPELTRVAESYTTLTGKPDLPPLWALGYQQSKWSYFPEQKVKDIAKGFRDRHIPCDVIHLDIDYMDGFKCFTWDKDRFPDPRRMIAELEADGFKTVVILDPGLKIDKSYPLYIEGVEKRMFCRRADGPLMKGKVWPGECHFPDFTSPRVRAWWSGLFTEFMKSGIHGIWNDMNEPAVLEVGTFPNDTRHEYDGSPVSHRKAHNVYGMQMARATYHGVKEAGFPRRPFLLTRSGYAGVQRYAAVWTGDNLATWDHLWIANIQCQRLSVSGMSFAGSDVGGFIGECNPELMVRWMQLGAFHPLFRTHSSRDYGNREPWSYGEPYTSAIRIAIETRYRFLPYLYTAFWRYHFVGTPIMRPLCFLDQQDLETHRRMEEFGVGENIVVCPISEPGSPGRNMYLPAGGWYNYWTDEQVEGGQEFFSKHSLINWPIYMKAGSVIPHYPVIQSTEELDLESLDLHVYTGAGPCTSELYEDAGEYLDYQQGSFCHRTFTVAKDEKGFSLEHRQQGRYNVSYTSFRILIHGLGFTPGEMQLDGKVTSGYQTEVEGRSVWVVMADEQFSTLQISVSHAEKKPRKGIV
ncbi:MAG: glycoside hydrolase family 31 protein [Bacteroidia bacterium]|nr:glycoside hydrolase family 31 protein [Bacteroidia bacterium]